MQNKSLSAAERASIVMEVLREQETVAQIAQKYDVNPKTLYAWKKEFVENAAIIFESPAKKQGADKDKQIDSLYQQIGQLQVEVNWLKKKSAAIKSR